MPLSAPLPPIARAVAVFVVLSTVGASVMLGWNLVYSVTGAMSSTPSVLLGNLLLSVAAVGALCVGVAAWLRWVPVRAAWFAMLAYAVATPVANVLRLSGVSPVLLANIVLTSLVLPATLLWLTHRLLRHPLARSADVLLPGPVARSDPAGAPSAQIAPAPLETRESAAASDPKPVLRYASPALASEPPLRAAAFVALMYSVVSLAVLLGNVASAFGQGRMPTSGLPETVATLARVIALVLTAAVSFVMYRTATTDRFASESRAGDLAFAAARPWVLAGLVLLATSLASVAGIARSLPFLPADDLARWLAFTVPTMFAIPTLVFLVARAGDPPRGVSGVG